MFNVSLRLSLFEKIASGCSGRSWAISNSSLITAYLTLSLGLSMREEARRNELSEESTKSPNAFLAVRQVFEISNLRGCAGREKLAQ